MLTRQRTKILLGSVMLLLISVAVTITHNVTNTHASPQNQDRILKQRSWPNEPVKIKLVTSKKGAIKLGETFSDDDDWFRGLTLKIENKSDKAITYIALSLMFKRPDGETGRPLAYSIRYNQRSARFIGKESEVTVSTQYPPIQPGEFADVKTFEHDFNSIKSLLLQAGYVGGIKAIDIVLEEVIFGDGSGWPGIKRDSRPTDRTKVTPSDHSLLLRSPPSEANYFSIFLPINFTEDRLPIRKSNWKASPCSAIRRVWSSYRSISYFLFF